MSVVAERTSVDNELAPKAWVIAAAAMFCCGWGGNQFTPLLVMYRQADGFSEVVVDALLGAYVFGLVPALLVGGHLSDRHGRKNTMAVALLACILGSALIATAQLPALFAGRLLSGIGIGLAMGVGSTWVVELTVRGGADAPVGARRAALWLTGGLGFGAGLAGVVAQWLPFPQQLAYLIQIASAVVVLGLLVTAGFETVNVRGACELGYQRDASAAARRLLPSVVKHDRFRGLILPLAPWIFCAGGIAYATVPAALDSHVRSWSLLYATILTVTTLGAGFLIQPLANRLDQRVKAIGLLAGTLAMTVGIATAAIAVGAQNPWMAIVPAIVLGCAYGVMMVAGLLEIQRLSPPEELARATGVFYALAYVGFLFPMMIAIADHWSTTTIVLWALTVLCGVSGVTVARRAFTRR